MTPTAKKKAADRLPRLLQRRPNILLWLYYWRYADVDTIRRCYPDVFTSAASAQRFFKRCRQYKLVQTAQPGRQHQQDLHSLTGRAVKWLAGQYPKLTFRQTQDAVSSPFNIEHERAISHFQADLLIQVQRRDDLAITHFERRYFHPDQAMPWLDQDGIQRRLEPDLGYLLLRRDQAKRHWLPLWQFVEIDRGHESTNAVGDKIKNYLNWYNYRGEEQLRIEYQTYGDFRPLFQLLFITRHRQDTNSFRHLVRLYTEGLRVGERAHILFTTFDQLASWQAGGSAQIWYPLHWFKSAWRRQLEPDLYRPQVQGRVHDFVQDKLSSWSELYSLFPPAEATPPRATTPPQRRQVLPA